MQFEMMSWITICMGLFLMVVGIVIWAGKKIDLVHGVDAAKVYECDKDAYARLLGIGVMLISCAVLSYGIITCFPAIPPFVYWITIGVFGAAGIIVMLIGQKKYFNGNT